MTDARLGNDLTPKAAKNETETIQNRLKEPPASFPRRGIETPPLSGIRYRLKQRAQFSEDAALLRVDRSDGHMEHDCDVLGG